jgi:uncharacterized protein (TIGR02118 family)
VPSARQHRIFLPPVRPEVDPGAAARHWATTHARLVRDMPGLLGYEQHHALTPARYVGWSETWFASRADEQAAFASDVYRERIAPDEDTVFAREAAWSSAVLASEVVRPGPTAGFRLLAFGAGADTPLPAGVVRAELLRLHQPGPGPDGADVALSAWAATADPLVAAAGRCDGLAIVSRRVAIVAPPA